MDNFAVFVEDTARRSGRQQPRTVFLLALLLTAIYGCANVSSLKGLPTDPAPQAPSPLVLPEKSKWLTPFAITMGPDGNLWFGNCVIPRLDESRRPGRFLHSIWGAERWPSGSPPGPTMRFGLPTLLEIVLAGLLWTGTTAYVPLPTPESGPAAIVNATDGNLWFTEHAANRVGRLTPLGTLTEFALPKRGGPAGIAEGSDGKLYIAENSGERIDQMSMDGRVQEFRLPSSGGRPDSVVKGADGDIWFTEFAAEKVGRLTMAGHIQEYALTAQGPPVGLAAGPTGDIWVTVPMAHAICRLDPDGSEHAYYLQGNMMPGMIAAGSDGNLWFTQPNGMLGRLSPSGTIHEFPAVLSTRTAPPPAAEHLLIRGAMKFPSIPLLRAKNLCRGYSRNHCCRQGLLRYKRVQ